jgi:nucleoside-diphosphate-sugar epimerase
LNRKKILITGGTGFIGYHLAKKCLKLNWQVTSISTSKPKKVRKLKKVRYIICDLSNQKKLNKIVKRNFDYVVNLAGHVDHSKKIKTIQSHYFGCKNLSLIFLKSKIKKFVQVGSSIEYGKINSPQHEYNFNNRRIFSTYGTAKLLSTKFLLNLYKQFNFPVTIFRLYLVYGPKQDVNRVIPITISNALKNFTFDCTDGSQLRDFIYIDDVTNAILKALRKKLVEGEIINIGSGKPIKIKKIILKICRLLKKGNPQFGKLKLRRDEIKNLYPNIKKARKLLNWKPKINFEKGLLKTIIYYKNIKF